ncbi:heterokaryon incompatibility domain-containing protein [Trichoderma compactum]
MTHLHDAFASPKYPGPSLPTPNHIRLVSLLPGSTSTITCELITVDIHSAPAYEALSYTWENDLDPLRSNCISAPHRLRYKDRPRMLWVDSLAINQSDISEKNHQLTLMSKIYSQATKVIIYLGDSDTTPLSYPKSELLTDALYSFFRRPWFTRVWVIQDAFLSNAAFAYCGEKTIPWSTIENFYSWDVTSKWLRQLPFVLYASEKSLIRSNVESSMFMALNRTRHCSAANQRDKVYAQLPLFQSFSEQLDITPDYGGTVAKVYMDCAIALLPECGFNLLSAVQGRPSIDDLPARVPDWSITRKHINGEQLPTLNTDIYANNAIPTVSLHVTGHLCGRISGIESAYIVGRKPLPLLERQRLAFGGSVVDQRIEGEPLSESMSLKRIFYALLAASNEEHVVDYVYNFFTWYQHDWWYQDYETSLANETFVEDTLPFEDIPFHLAASELGRSMQVYTGYMGIAPDNARIMDQVYICAGSDVPFAFREVHGKPHGQVMKQICLIGQCHLEQEAWNDIGKFPMREGTWKLYNFTIFYQRQIRY